MLDQNCLSYWYPILQTAGVPTPETRIIKTDVELGRMIDGGKTPANFDIFLFDLIKAGNELGFPLFLRTGHGAAKHYWAETCYVEKRFDFPACVRALVEWSECVDMMGLPYNVWAVRKLLKTAPAFTAFKGFPVVKERRYFIEDGKVICGHNYWPADAVVKPSVPNWKALLTQMNYQPLDEIKHLSEMSERVAHVFPGAWSVDWLQDAAGKWWCTDMAQASKSYHWDGCPNETRFNAHAR